MYDFYPVFHTQQLCYCYDTHKLLPRPSLFYPSVVDQIPLGAAAISQVSSALDAGCSAKLVRCEDQPDLCSASERQKGFVVNKRLSFGSFDILDTDDLNEAGKEKINRAGQYTVVHADTAVFMFHVKAANLEAPIGKFFRKTSVCLSHNYGDHSS